MFLPIEIDYSELKFDFKLSIENISVLNTSILNSVTDHFIQVLTSNARVLGKTRQQYLNGLKVYDKDSFTKEIVLHGWLPNALEQGAEPFDQKIGFAKSSLIKRSKSGGWYLIIPFSHGIPSSIGENVSSKMPKEVHDIAKTLAPKQQLKKQELPDKYQKVLTRKKIETDRFIFSEYTHKSPINEGMQKSSMKGHSHYNTFRIVSDKSDYRSWIHPGFKPIKLFEKTFDEIQKNIPDIADRAIDEYLSSLGF